jgi:hypothetical protein
MERIHALSEEKLWNDEAHDDHRPFGLLSTLESWNAQEESLSSGIQPMIRKIHQD